jgi:hypothetical protein
VAGVALLAAEIAATFLAVAHNRDDALAFWAFVIAAWHIEKNSVVMLHHFF